MSTEKPGQEDVHNREQEPVQEPVQEQVQEEARPEVGEAVEAETEAPGVGEAQEAEAGAGGEELEKLREQLLLSQAEMQNLRRRAERDVEKAHKFALEKFVADLLPVVDNLERAIAAIDREDATNDSVLEGVELTLKSLLDVLQRFKVEQIDPRGETFDPEQHQAMSMTEDADARPNTVVEVFQKGYKLNGRLIRPAMVVVAKG